MEPLEWIAIIGGILSALGIGADLIQTNKANKKQMEHDEAMAALNHRYREEEALTSFEREANFNQYESDVKKMTSAGLSPALMYGQMSGASTSPSVSSVGSSQSAGNVGRTASVSNFLGKLDPAEYGEAMIQRFNARTMAKKTESDIALQKQYQLESLSRTLENQRNTSFKKSLETTLFNQEQQMLNQLRIGNELGEFELGLKRDTRALTIEKQELENRHLERQIDLVTEQIKTEPVARARLRKEIDEITQNIENLKIGYEQTEQNIAVSKESLKGTQLERIMKEFGLNGRTMNFAKGHELFDMRYRENIKAATLALEELGFSEIEAQYAALYYLASDPKDVTPSLINGFSRILSSFHGKTVTHVLAK